MRSFWGLLSLLLLGGVQAFANQLPNQFTTTKSIEERLAELEANQNLRYMNLSGTLTSLYDHVSADEAYPHVLDSSDLQYLRLRFSLNADAEINPQIRVYSRLTATKFMNNWRSQGGSPVYISDIEGVYSNSGSQVFLEKAYVDLSCPDSIWTVSVGRLPTVNGSPGHFWDLLPRQGTYPLLTFDAPLDGIAMTIRLDSFLDPGHEISMRMLYTPFSDVMWGGNHKYLLPPTNDTNNGAQVGDTSETLISMGAVQVDYTLTDLSLADEATGILQFYKSGRLPFFTDQGSSNLNIVGDGLTALVEFNSIAETHFDLSISHTYTNTVSEGLLAPGLGFGTDQANGSSYGSLTLLSTRYRFEDWALGLEWLSSSDVPFYFSAAPEDLTRFYSTPGNSGHIYVVTKWMSLVTLRAGYRQQNYTSIPIGFGPVQSTDRVLKTYYISLRTDF